jgi:hypothetical protein
LASAGFEPLTFQPVASCYTNWTIPGHTMGDILTLMGAYGKYCGLS